MELDDLCIFFYKQYDSVKWCTICKWSPCHSLIWLQS